MAHPTQQHACWCATCRPVVFGDMRMVLCPDCGNKRCPRATDHRNVCSGSNELGQAGSAYTAHPAPQRIINGTIMTQEEIEAIAQRPTCRKPFGETVTISRAERDALVAMARDGKDVIDAAMRLRTADQDLKSAVCRMFGNPSVSLPIPPQVTAESSVLIEAEDALWAALDRIVMAKEQA